MSRRTRTAGVVGRDDAREGRLTVAALPEGAEDVRLDANESFACFIEVDGFGLFEDITNEGGL